MKRKREPVNSSRIKVMSFGTVWSINIKSAYSLYSLLSFMTFNTLSLSVTKVDISFL